MGVLQRFERRLGGMVEGAFAKVFKGEVQPVEIAGALQRETDDRKAVVGQGRVLVPNDFVVELGDHDHERLSPWAEPLGAELGKLVEEHATEQRYSFVGPIRVAFEHHAELDTGVFRIRSGVTAAEGGSAGPSAVPVPGGGFDSAPGGMPGHPRLVISAPEGGREGRGGGSPTFALERPVTVIGRGPEADLRLPDPGVSRRHAEIQLVDDAVVLVDLGSTNGTLVNDAPVTRRRLSPGDRIEVGSTTLLFRQDES